jgi:hypothetical protein
MRNPPARVYPDWNHASRRPILPTRSARKCQTNQRSARIALPRRERPNLNASTAFCPRRPPGLHRLDALPKQLDQRRRSNLRHRRCLQSAPRPKEPIEPISRKFRSVARLLTRRQSDQMLQPIRPLRASLLRQPKRLSSLRRLEVPPKPLGRSRRLRPRRRQRLQNNPLRKRPVEPISRFRSGALLPATRQRDRMPRLSHLRQALLLRRLKRPPVQSRHMLPPMIISPHGKPTGL